MSSDEEAQVREQSAEAQRDSVPPEATHKPFELPLALSEAERSELETVLHGNGIEYWAGVYSENPVKGGLPLLAHAVLLGDTRTPGEVSDEFFRRGVKAFSRSNVASM